MTSKKFLLAERRKRLVERSAEQRLTLAHNIAPWRTPLTLADRCIDALHYIKHHPEWTIGGIALLIALRPTRAIKWLGRGLFTWQMLQKLDAEPWKPEKAR